MLGDRSNGFYILPVPVKKTTDSLYIQCFHPATLTDVEWVDPNGFVYTSNMTVCARIILDIVVGDLHNVLYLPKNNKTQKKEPIALTVFGVARSIMVS